MRLALEAVEREAAKLWEEESRRTGKPRIELMTLVALVSEPRLLDRAQKVVAQVVRSHPSRTIVAACSPGAEPAITADVALHRPAQGADACGDAITLEAVGEAREWLPATIERMSLSDLPVCLWWVGDLPDDDDLFDRLVLEADLVVVHSGEMDLRDLPKLSSIVSRSRGRYAMSDLTWIRLRSLQELVARFFDDAQGQACLPEIARVAIDFVPREAEEDVASTQAALLFGWIAQALGLPVETVKWTRGEGWAEARVGSVAVRFAPRACAEAPSGTIMRVSLECAKAKFEVERQADAHVFRWSRDVPGAPTPPQTVRATMDEDAALLLRCLQRPMRDRLFELSLETSSRAVLPVAPRRSLPPRAK